ncbi:hypothetical protein HC928_10410 [bacterium]|nr:hypothetical protein [bacterium]
MSQQDDYNRKNMAIILHLAQEDDASVQELRSVLSNKPFGFVVTLKSGVESTCEESLTVLTDLQKIEQQTNVFIYIKADSVVQDNQRLYLSCKNETSQITQSGLIPIEDLVKEMISIGARHIGLILDIPLSYKTQKDSLKGLEPFIKGIAFREINDYEHLRSIHLILRIDGSKDNKFLRRTIDILDSNTSMFALGYNIGVPRLFFELIGSEHGDFDFQL